MQLFNWLTLDIETIGGRPEDAERDMRMNWAPNPTWKPDTIGKRYLEMLEKKRERLALIDGSRVVSVALRSNPEAAQTRVLHCLYVHDANAVGGALIEGFATEREMLAALRALLGAHVGDQTTLVGHNIADFDLPKLRMAYLRNGLALPACLAGDQDIFDTMRVWGRKFSATRDPFVSLADVFEILGVESHKDLVDGSQVDQLYAEGKHDLLIKYNLLDVLAEDELFRRMTGQLDDAAAGAAAGVVGAPALKTSDSPDVAAPVDPEPTDPAQAELGDYIKSKRRKVSI